MRCGGRRVGIGVMSVLLRWVWRHVPAYVAHALYIALGGLLLVGADVTVRPGALMLVARGLDDSTGFVGFVGERADLRPLVCVSHELGQVLVIVAALRH